MGFIVLVSVTHASGPFADLHPHYFDYIPLSDLSSHLVLFYSNLAIVL